MTKQLEFPRWGGKRRGAGRPNKSKTVNHMTREQVDLRKPLLITQKLQPGLTTLRRRDLLRAFKRSAEQAKRFSLHVIHFSLLSNHIHMLVETKNNQTLANGMRSLAGSFGKIVAKLSKMRGKVFLGRYHLRLITSPTQMRNALQYVLLNYCKHAGIRECIDAFSSAQHFPDWRKLLGRRWNAKLQGELCDAVAYGLSPASSWLARVGWMRAAA